MNFLDMAILSSLDLSPLHIPTRDERRRQLAALAGLIDEQRVMPKRFLAGRRYRPKSHIKPRISIQGITFDPFRGVTTRRPDRDRLGFAMGCVKDDDSQLPFIMPWPGCGFEGVKL